MGCKISLKIHILDAHLDEFKENMDAYCKKQGKPFIRTYWISNAVSKDKYNERMIGDYIWGLIRKNDLQYCQKFRKTMRF